MEPIKEVTQQALNAERFIKEKVAAILSQCPDVIAISALSGGVDSSVATMITYRALGKRLHAYVIDNGLMRADEPMRVYEIFKNLGVNVTLMNVAKDFLKALEGITDPEAKREAITQAFYSLVFRDIIRRNQAACLVQGTILTDIEETAAGIKRQHNVLKQIGIDPQEAFGYQIIEPLVELRKPAVRELAYALQLPLEICERRPFPGPALAARIIGAVTQEKLDLVRKATKILEDTLQHTTHFQSLAILHEDKVTGIREGKRQFGWQIELRIWTSIDAVTATPLRLTPVQEKMIVEKILREMPDVVSITQNLTPKPPSTIEAV